MAILQWLQWGNGGDLRLFFVKELTSLCYPHGQSTMVTTGGGATFSQVVCERLDKKKVASQDVQLC